MQKLGTAQSLMKFEYHEYMWHARINGASAIIAKWYVA